MTEKTSGVLGMLTTIFFVFGFAYFFSTNPLAFEEVNKLSIAAYNLVGMNGRLFAIIVYLTTGFLNVLFAVSLLRRKKNKVINKIGVILLAVTGMVWISFGLLPYQYEDDLGIHLFLIRICSTIFIGAIGLVVLAVDYFENQKDRFLKVCTLSTGILILSIGALSVFVYDDDTWVRTNVSLIIYFSWFGVFGLRLLMISRLRMVRDVGKLQ